MSIKNICTLFLYIYLIISNILVNTVTTLTVIEKGIIPLEKDSVAIQFYLDIENDDPSSACRIDSWVKRCCLTIFEEQDCTAMKVHGEDMKFLRANYRDTILFVYPTLHQHDLVGYCAFILDHNCGQSDKKKREEIKVKFDTRVITIKKRPYKALINYIGDREKFECDTLDQDSLNNCEPVNCDEKYLEQRPFYDYVINRCIKVPVCFGDPDKELPDIIYLPESNTCRDLEHPLTIQDIYTINTGSDTVTLPSKAKDDFKVELKSNCSTISQNLNLILDMMCGKLYPLLNSDMTDYSRCCKTALISILACIIGICVVLLSFVFCMNAAVWIHRKWTNGDLKNYWKKFKNKFKKHDMSQYNFVCEKVNKEVRNTLLREVIVRDIPVELRDSAIDICERMENEVRWKKRYRKSDVGSQISLQECNRHDVTTPVTTSSISLRDAKGKLVK